MEATILSSLDELVIDKIKLLAKNPDRWCLTCQAEIDGYKLIINIIQKPSRQKDEGLKLPDIEIPY